MRLHHLEVTAFGPFPETVRIDLDALSEAGLFLLAGPTGAGKSSVLDAVCFALYGDVPGDRAGAKRLRCDQAEEGVAPRVVLEATLGGRRYRIDRSPAWLRPKRRGEGTTTQQARVVLCERVDGEWVPLSTRLDEAGHLVSHRLGLTLAQFCQVALLPQGRFQAFLRARSEDRHALLQQVFRTGRFDQVERWLRDRRVALRRESATHEEAVADLVSRSSEVSGTEPPAGWQDAPVTLTDWAAGLSRAAGEHEVLAQEHDESCGTVLTAAEDAARQGRGLAALQERYAAAVTEAARLQARRQEVQAVAERLEVDRRARSVVPVVRLAEGAVRRAEAAAAALTSALAELGAALGESVVDDAAVPALQGETTAILAEVARARPVEERLEETRASAAAVAEARRTLELRFAQVECRARLLPDELSGVRAALAEVEAAAARADELEGRVANLRERRSAHLAATALAADLAGAERELAASVGVLQAAKETWLDLREQRLDGMAAEIAAALVVGGCCPVCGSADHPSPAAGRVGAPDAAAEREARRRVDDLEATTEAHAQHVRDLAGRLAAVQARAGESPEGIESALALGLADLQAARADADRAEEARQKVAVLAAEQAAAAAEVERLRPELTRHEAEQARLGALTEELAAQVGRVLDGRGHETLEQLAEHLAALDQACRLAAAAREEATRADHVRAQAQAAAQQAACEAGFEGAADLPEAVLGDAERLAFETQVEEHRRAHDRAAHALADPELVGAAALPSPDLVALEEARTTAHQEAARARRAHDAAVERSRRVAGLGEELTAALAAWQPVREELDLTAGLASFVEGRSPDNRLQMRLSAYVLARRLTQVVAAANLRLAAMSDQRYSLLHTGRRGAGETRGGLSLLVRDDWSGESRDPATLSGGETFVVSLALALGLADVIAGESGGADLDTLFVDEGFGSLDADTLDDVMDTLDSLRDGGRVVGVVSHVPELQTRIPTQLRLHKARHGSRASLRLG